MRLNNLAPPLDDTGAEEVAADCIGDNLSFREVGYFLPFDAALITFLGRLVWQPQVARPDVALGSGYRQDALVFTGKANLKVCCPISVVILR